MKLHPTARRRSNSWPPVRSTFVAQLSPPPYPRSSVSPSCLSPARLASNRRKASPSAGAVLDREARGFSSFSKAHAPDQVRESLSGYRCISIPLILEGDGTLGNQPCKEQSLIGHATPIVCSSNSCGTGQAYSSARCTRGLRHALQPAVRVDATLAHARFFGACHSGIVDIDAHLRAS